MNKYALILFLFTFLIAGPEGRSMHLFKKLSLKLNDDPFVKSDSTNCVIPFSRAGNLILIKAKADTTEGNFILDTGAPGLVLNITYFKNHESINKDAESGGITGKTQTLQTSVNKFSLGPVTYFRVDQTS